MRSGAQLSGELPWREGNPAGHSLIRQADDTALTVVFGYGPVRAVVFHYWQADFFERFGRDADPNVYRWEHVRSTAIGVEDLWRAWELGAAQGIFDKVVKR